MQLNIKELNKIFTLRTLTLKDLTDVMHLHDCACQELGENKYYVDIKLTKESLAQKYSCGIFTEENKIISMRLVHVGVIGDKYLNLLPILEKSPIGAYFPGSYVFKKYRGLKLASKMTNNVIFNLKNNDIEHIYATVHPENISNQSLLKSQGFIEVYQGVFHNSKPRILFYKKI
ncbi:GNAT family N-acetyltransferase [Fluviispira vulneris]|uniref:GNAT family N-acetyltransferase n=1 Tax=Fluviispira vulneris TaxID=2763012 RepID=UPI001645643B|nr:GNAT family N-acetyltransferase [Fluviispira vulneris]